MTFVINHITPKFKRMFVVNMDCFSYKIFVDISLLKLSYDIFVTFCIVCFGGKITDKDKIKIEKNIKRA